MSKKARFPEKDARLFKIANETSFCGKQIYYSKVKDVILKKYGIHDNYDLQTIKKTCWDCNGTGEFIRARIKEICWSCRGTGIYSTRTFILERYKIGEDVYHIPQFGQAADKVIVSKIEGRIIHKSDISPEQARKAFLYLFAKYNTYEFIGYVIEAIRTKGTGILEIKNFVDKLIRAIKYKQAEMTDELPF